MKKLLVWEIIPIQGLALNPLQHLFPCVGRWSSWFHALGHNLNIPHPKTTLSSSPDPDNVHLFI